MTAPTSILSVAAVGAAATAGPEDGTRIGRDGGRLRPPGYPDASCDGGYQGIRASPRLGFYASITCMTLNFTCPDSQTDPRDFSIIQKTQASNSVELGELVELVKLARDIDGKMESFLIEF